MSFNPQAFLDASVRSSNDTKAVPIPMGDYMGVIEKVVPRQWQSKDGSKSGVALDIFWTIEDEQLKVEMGRTELKSKQGIMLDLDKEGSLDTSKGKNIGLGRLREAVGKNEDGEAFTFGMLPGLSAKVTISHRVDGEDTYSEVKSVTRL